MTTMNTGAASFKEFRAALCRFNDANTPVSIADRVMILSNAIFLLDEYERANITPQADAAPIGMHVAALLAARDWLTDSNSPHALRNQIDAAIAAGGAQEPAAARDVLAERRRQMSVEGWTPEHDDEHANGDMALAAACYAASAGGVPWSDDVPSFWPWADKWWKPTTPRRDLVKAGALILAEIERLDRAAASNGEQA